MRGYELFLGLEADWRVKERRDEQNVKTSPNTPCKYGSEHRKSSLS